MPATKIKVTRWNCECAKCKERWQSRTHEKPKICPFCKTPNWEKPRREELTP